MSASTSPTSKDGPSMTEEVLMRAADTVNEIRKAGKAAASTKSSTSSAASPTTRQKRAAKSGAVGGVTGGGEDEESKSRCLVYCRLRPSTKRDFQDGATNIVALPEGHRVVIKDERHYNYDGTFGAKATQEEVFNAVAVPCVQHAFSGFCSALMCYGQTGTGKSYTMCNTVPAHEGIIPRAAKDIFQTIANAAGDGRTYSVLGQFVQIYRDHLGDLMVHDGKDRVDIHYDPFDGVSLTGCSTHRLANEVAFMRFYNEGNGRRVVTATAMNPESSRGHTAMVIHIVSEAPDDPMTGRMQGKITFIDLAGYERFSKTGITSDNPIMKDEAKTINASLLALGHVVSSLSSGSKHIPWRNSKLTRILQDSIGGHSRTSIILTIGPSSDHLYETTNSLQFGLRAMAVKVKARISVTVDYEKLSNKLMGLLNERDARINVLELQIASRDAERQELLDRYQQDRADLEVRFEKELETLTAAGATEEQIHKLKEVHNVEVQNLQDQQAEELDYQDEQHSKEITKLINEQKHQEAKSLTAMRLAQESIVEDFQRKLEHAREGTNDDLIHSLQQLSEKDTILASRASDTARLHSHIAVLTEQVRALGGEPAEPEQAFLETYLDVAQVEEMKTRLDGKVERLRNKIVDLQTQLDRVTLICSDRNDEISNLLDENQEMREHLAQTGAEMKDFTMELQRLKAKRAEMVDAEELETLRLRMQADIDELKSQRNAVQAELTKAEEDKKSLLKSTPSRAVKQLCRSRRSAARFSCCASVNTQQDGAPGVATDSFHDNDGAVSVASTSCSNLLLDNTSNASSVYAESKTGSPVRSSYRKTNQMRNVYKKHIKKLNYQLIVSCAAKNARRQRVEELEALLRANDIDVPPPSVPDPEERMSLALVPSACGGGLFGFSQSASRRNSPSNLAGTVGGASATAMAADDAAAGSEPAAAIDPDIAVILKIREDEGRMQERILREQEHYLTRGRSNSDYIQQLVSILTTQLQAAGLTPHEPAVSLQPFETLPIDEYTSLLRDLRLCNRKVLLQLLQRATGSGGAPATVPADVAAAAAELEERDNQLELKDELLLEKAAMSQYMAKISGRLISQMDTLGLTPCCMLPDSFQEIADTEVDLLEVQTEKQRELEERLQHEEEERRRMNRLLNAFSAEREHQSLVLRQAEAKNKQLEESQGRAVQTIHRLAAEKTQREKILEETARRLTRELMETQARLAQSETERKASVFDRIFGRM